MRRSRRSKARESVYRGDVATVSATIKIDGYAGRDVAVTLERPGASPMRQTVHAPARPMRLGRSCRLPYRSSRRARSRSRSRLSRLPGDVRPDNDRRTISIQVVDDKARVLLVDSEPRWELRYLRNAVRARHVASSCGPWFSPDAGKRGSWAYLRNGCPTARGWK